MTIYKWLTAHSLRVSELEWCLGARNCGRSDEGRKAQRLRDPEKKEYIVLRKICAQRDRCDEDQSGNNTRFPGFDVSTRSKPTRELLIRLRDSRVANSYPLPPFSSRPSTTVADMSQFPADLERKGSEKSSADIQITHGDGEHSGEHMHRALKGRQVSMIAIAGTIGTGLFL
jgi:hypothetical protein